MGFVLTCLVAGLLAPPLTLGGRQGRAAHRQTLEAAAYEDPEAAFRLAQGLARTQPKAALAMALRAQKLGAHPLRVRLLRGDILRDSGHPGAAISAYFEVAEAAPNQAYAHLQLWLLLRDARLPATVDRRRVRRLLLAAGYHLAVTPTRPRDRAAALALIEHGQHALRSGRFSEATQIYESAVAQDDDLAAGFAGLAEAHARLEQHRRAEGARRLFVFLEPRATRARRVAYQQLQAAERRRGLDRDRATQATRRRARRSSR
jgi:tetratricopeptide (TPR) repeat protein